MLSLSYAIALIMEYLPPAIVLGIPAFVFYRYSHGSVMWTLIGVDIAMIGGAWFARDTVTFPIILLIILVNIAYWGLKFRNRLTIPEVRF